MAAYTGSVAVALAAVTPASHASKPSRCRCGHQNSERTLSKASAFTSLYHSSHKRASSPLTLRDLPVTSALATDDRGIDGNEEGAREGIRAEQYDGDVAAKIINRRPLRVILRLIQVRYKYLLGSPY
eukprot:909685-Prorocentrum_minimum.AAC.4